jgi:hypothetical protein
LSAGEPGRPSAEAVAVGIGVPGGLPQRAAEVDVVDIPITVFVGDAPVADLVRAGVDRAHTVVAVGPEAADRILGSGPAVVAVTVRGELTRF